MGANQVVTVTCFFSHFLTTVFVYCFVLLSICLFFVCVVIVSVFFGCLVCWFVVFFVGCLFASFLFILCIGLTVKDSSLVLFVCWLAICLLVVFGFVGWFVLISSLALVLLLVMFFKCLAVLKGIFRVNR